MLLDQDPAAGAGDGRKGAAVEDVPVQGASDDEGIGPDEVQAPGGVPELVADGPKAGLDRAQIRVLAERDQAAEVRGPEVRLRGELRIGRLAAQSGLQESPGPLDLELGLQHPLGLQRDLRSVIPCEIEGFGETQGILGRPRSAQQQGCQAYDNRLSRVGHLPIK